MARRVSETTRWAKTPECKWLLPVYPSLGTPQATFFPQMCGFGYMHRVHYRFRLMNFKNTDFHAPQFLELRAWMCNLDVIKWEQKAKKLFFFHEPAFKSLYHLQEMPTHSFGALGIHNSCLLALFKAVSHYGWWLGPSEKKVQELWLVCLSPFSFLLLVQVLALQCTSVLCLLDLQQTGYGSSFQILPFVWTEHWAAWAAVFTRGLTNYKLISFLAPSR